MIPAHLMGHRCDIDRLVDGRDDFNKPLTDTEERYVGVPCYLSGLSTVGGNDERSTLDTRDMVTMGYKLFLPLDYVVAESDRIREVRDADGQVLARDLNILAVRPISRPSRVHHLEVTVEVRRGSQTWATA
jgi:hypothetical protein